MVRIILIPVDGQIFATDKSLLDIIVSGVFPSVKSSKFSKMNIEKCKIHENGREKYLLTQRKNPAPKMIKTLVLKCEFSKENIP